MTDQPGTTPESSTTPRGTPTGPGGWQTAGKGASGAGTVMVTIYGMALIAIGIAMMTAGGTAVLVGIGVAAYGLYLAIPGGRKWVIY